MSSVIIPPNNDAELMVRAKALAGMTLGQLAAQIFPDSHLSYHKGWTGQLLEYALGADAKNLPAPDFSKIKVELKSLPLGRHGMPSESTFVTSISLSEIAKETWETSTVFLKLKKVLWVPVEGDVTIPLSQRRIGEAFLWSPSNEQQILLRQDWEELTNMIVMGQLEGITARQGKCLQVRPKAADGKALCSGYDAQGNKIATLPRGFYLRASFTKQLA